MSDLADAISWFFSDDDVARVIALLLWLAISAVLLPCFARCVIRRPRYLDPLFSAALVLTLNRIAFGIQAYVQEPLLADLCRWSGNVGAGFYLFVVWDYLRPERV